MIGSWLNGLVLNGVIGAAFLTIGAMLAVQLTRTRQWGSNTIGTVFTVLVLACGAGHALRTVLALGPAWGVFGTAGLAMRIEFADWHMWIADLLTATAGVVYVVARVRNRDILQTTRAFEDYRSRRRRAIEVHDSVVQDLVAAKLCLEQGHRAEARKALRSGLDASKEIVSQGQRSDPVEPEDPGSHDGEVPS